MNGSFMPKFGMDFKSIVEEISYIKNVRLFFICINVYANCKGRHKFAKVANSGHRTPKVQKRPSRGEWKCDGRCWSAMQTFNCTAYGPHI
jgi:hypothetical protein